MGVELGIELANIASEGIPAIKPTDNSVMKQTENSPKSNSIVEPTKPPPNDDSVVEQPDHPSDNNSVVKSLEGHPAAQTEYHQKIDSVAKLADNHPEHDDASIQAKEELAGPKDDPAQEMVEPARKGDPDTKPAMSPHENDATLRHWHSMVSPTHSAVKTEISPKEWEDQAKSLREIAH
jgi:hypothetical protein